MLRRPGVELGLRGLKSSSEGEAVMKEAMVTEEEVAFLNAKRVLDKLTEIGVEAPSVTLHPDGSGRFHLGPAAQLTEDNVDVEAVYDAIGSRRVSMLAMKDDVQIDFCESLKGELK